MVTFIDYVGKRNNRVVLSFRRDGESFGCLEVDYLFPYPIVGEESQLEDARKLIEQNEELKDAPYEFYNQAKRALHVLLHPSRAGLLRKLMTGNRKKSLLRQPRADDLLKWGLNPITGFDGSPKDSYRFTPFWNHEVKLSGSLESELKEKSRAKRKDLSELEVGDYITEQALWKERVAFYDCETTQFKREDKSVDWATLLLVEGSGEIVRKEIHTTRKIHRSEYDGFQIIGHETGKKVLEEGVTRSIVDFDPWLAMAWNCNFDLYEAPKRTKAKLAIGLDDSVPAKKVSLSTRERIHISGREVIDLLSLSKFYFKYLPNFKLDTVARFLAKKWGFEWQGKSASYEELAKLSVSDKPEDLVKMIQYCQDDVLAMHNIVFSPASSLLEDVFRIARECDISLTEACNREGSTEDMRDKHHFLALGYHRDTGYGGKMRMDAARKYTAREKEFKSVLLKQEKTSKQEQISDLMLGQLFHEHEEKARIELLHSPEIKKGRFERVSQVHVPWGVFAIRLLVNKHPAMKNLYLVYSGKIGEHRKHAVSQWINGLAEKLFIDLYFYEHSSKELESMLSDSKLDKSFFTTLFSRRYDEFIREYKRKAGEGEKRSVISEFLTEEGTKLLTKLRDEKSWDFTRLVSVLDQDRLVHAHNLGFLGTHDCKPEEFRKEVQRNVDLMWDGMRGSFINLKGDYIFMQDYGWQEGREEMLVPVKRDFTALSFRTGIIVYDNEGILVGCGLQRAKNKTPEEIRQKTESIKSLLAGEIPFDDKIIKRLKL